MRSPLRLGVDPDDLEVHLTTGTPFRDGGTYQEDGVAVDWPDGATLSLIFGNGDTWAATISASEAQWDVAAATADAMPNNMAVRLYYTDASGESATWGIGRVIRHDR